MSITDLPDKCLLIIFGHLNNLDDLVNCYEVCTKWSDLVVERTKKAKYLIFAGSGPTDFVFYKEMKSNYGAILKNFFGNLELLDFSSHNAFKELKSKDIVELVKNQNSLKGLLYCKELIKDGILKFCNQLEMISTDEVDKSILKHGSSVKQLQLWDTLSSFAKVGHKFPNLESLYLNPCNEVSSMHYYGPEMKKLKILGMNPIPRNCFQFMDACPNLQSAYLIYDDKYLFLNESPKHKGLEDLVFDFAYSLSIEADDLEKVFKKYPNLKHVKLIDSEVVEDEQIEQFVQILPNLVLLDARGCPQVTQKSADFIRDYSERHGRSIKFYYKGNEDEIEKDWPQLSSELKPVCEGFNFMKHCFLKDYNYLPYFMTPIDD